MDNTGRDAGTPSSKAKLGNSHHQIIDADQIIDNNPYDLASPETLHRRAENIIYSFHHPCSLITGCRMRSRKSPGGIIARFTREMKERTRLNIHKLRYGPSTTNEGNIRTLENGQQVIDLKQQKTGNHVVIPVRPELQAILEKYDNRLPRTYEQKVNHLIKEIAREAGITEKVEVSYIENGEKKSRLVEKCDMVKTHTARRSGATNIYLAGIPTIAIMKITGHKTEREFMKYIKITEEQTALELMNHPYFSGKQASE